MKEKKTIDKLTKLRFEFNKELVKEQKEREKINRPENHDGSFFSFINVQKVYPNGYHAVVDFNLDVKKGEFIVLVGPSGCGKSTTLRMVCGLEEITAGALYINGVYANNLEPKDRGLSMVFQNYALFPHFTVYDNLAYGLKIKKIYAPILDKNGNQKVGIDKVRIKELQKELKWYLKNDPSNSELENVKHDINELNNKEIPLYGYRKLTDFEIDEKIQKAAKILNLTELLNRKPGQLSGGQCQRVALGRVIVSDAKLLLMDEPLSNLDAKLRVSMRNEITKLHKTLNATTIYVTHDQVEAMTMADRIVIMDRTLIKQIGTPSEVYEHPNCLFVASFIGSPAMNIVDAKLKDNSIFIGENKFIDDKEISSKVKEFYQGLLEEYNKKIGDFSNIFKNSELLEAETKELNEKIDLIKKAISEGSYPLKFGIRPESIVLADKGTKIKGTILSSELLGDEYHVNVKIGDNTFLMKLPSTFKCEIGAEILVEIDGNKYHIFDAISERTIR